MASSSSVDGSISYVNKKKKVRTAKLDDNVHCSCGWTQLGFIYQIMKRVIQGVHCIDGGCLIPRELLLTVKLVM